MNKFINLYSSSESEIDLRFGRSPGLRLVISFPTLKKGQWSKFVTIAKWLSLQLRGQLKNEDLYL